MGESVDRIVSLRRRIARIEGRGAGDGARLFATGHRAIDVALGGGLAGGRLHELFAAEPGDGGAAAGFAAMLAIRAGSIGQSILWLRTDRAERRGGRLYAPGLAALGGDPGAIVFATAADDKALLRAAGDAARCAALGAIVIECLGNPASLGLTTSRKLTLAIEQSGVTALLLRLDAAPQPSAAETRWAVRAAPSTPLAAGAPGNAAIEIELLRRRAGPSGMRWRVEWDHDRRALRDPALSGAVVSAAPYRSPADPIDITRRIA